MYRLALDTAYAITIHGCLGDLVPPRPFPHRDIPLSFPLAALTNVRVLQNGGHGRAPSLDLLSLDTSPAAAFLVVGGGEC